MRVHAIRAKAVELNRHRAADGLVIGISFNKSHWPYGCMQCSVVRIPTGVGALRYALYKSIIPCDGGMWETEASSRCVPNDTCSPEGTTFMSTLDSLVVSVKTRKLLEADYASGETQCGRSGKHCRNLNAG
jgi:hypothetical protein